jgi:prolipoprotein diacylglyceryltransferase
MTDLLFLIATGVMLTCLLLWGFKHLPGERWQVLAIVPGKKKDSSDWQGTNLTYYGFFIATSQLLSLTLLLVLLGAMNISRTGTILATSILLSVCVPSARVVARIVEKKQHTFTIGGASFVGILLAPFSILLAEYLLNRFSAGYLPMMPVLAAMAIAYTLGEGLGRLACISYGCCYGKPLQQCSTFTRWFFRHTGMIFYGDTKKVAYESKLSGERLVPVQAMTCIIFTLTALFGSWMFLQEMFTVTFVFCMTVTQIWRLLSEMLRADFRGFGKLSVYQKMGGIAVLYSLALACIDQQEISQHPIISEGISGLWHPGIIIGLQLAWILFFIYFGRSTVTSATVSFSLREDRI